MELNNKAIYGLSYDYSIPLNSALASGIHSETLEREGRTIQDIRILCL